MVYVYFASFRTLNKIKLFMVSLLIINSLLVCKKLQIHNNSYSSSLSLLYVYKLYMLVKYLHTCEQQHQIKKKATLQLRLPKITFSTLLYRVGIIGRQFDKRLESFAPYYSQALLLAELKRKPYSSLVLKIPTKKSAKQENSNLFINSIL
jgi:hypothetical protein